MAGGKFVSSHCWAEEGCGQALLSGGLVLLKMNMKAKTTGKPQFILLKRMKKKGKKKKKATLHW